MELKTEASPVWPGGGRSKRHYQSRITLEETLFSLVQVIIS
jgi:hypothetical protein